MPVETELKLSIAPEHLARLKRHPMLKAYSAARAVTRRVYSIYYDTPEFDLGRRAMALRLRSNGGGWVQTLKGGGSMHAGLHTRCEWEMPVRDEALDFDALQASGGKLPRGVKEKLLPVFVTDFSRTLRVVTYAGASIELCLDSGEVRAGEKIHPISELELELKSGAPEQLFRLALLLQDIVPLEIETTNKAERGYALLKPGEQKIAKAHIPDLSPAMDTASALQGMVWASLAHLQANVPGAVAKLDDEYLHQVRVALRRLRVTLALIAMLCPKDAELAALRGEVAALCKELGRSREWDVFVAATLASVDANGLDEAARNRILRNSERLREQHHAAVQQALQAQGFQRLLLRLGAWMSGDHLADNAARAALPDFAADILRRRGKQVNELGREIEQENDAARLHEFRIACKKLRYSADSFASLYPKNRTESYLAALAKLQDILGEIHDIAVAHILLDDLLAALPDEDFSAVRGAIARDYAGLMPELARAWKAFCKQDEFWRAT
jgi:triphosphatase